MAERKQSINGDHKALRETNWEDINEAGAYVETTTGNLFRVPREALQGAHPLIMREGVKQSRLVQVSKDPFVTVLEARLRCAQNNIAPDF